MKKRSRLYTSRIFFIVGVQEVNKASLDAAACLTKTSIVPNFLLIKIDNLAYDYIENIIYFFI